MRTSRRSIHVKGFTLIELLVVVLILGILTSIALPSFLQAVIDSRKGMANANALAIAKAVQANSLAAGSYDTTLNNFAADLGGTIPVNPCTGDNSGYTIVSSSSTSATVAANVGSKCGTWTPTTYSLIH